MGFFDEGIFGGGEGTEGWFGSHEKMQAKPAELNDMDYLTALQNQLVSNNNMNSQLTSMINAPQYSQLIQALSDQSQGQGPSVAQNQLNQTTAQNVNRAAAMAASQKGVDPALAARLAVDSGSRANQEAQGQAATLRAQEQLGAQSQLGNVLYQRGQLGAQQLGLGNQSFANYGSLNNAQNQNKTGNQLGAAGINQAAAGRNAQYGQQLAGGTLSGLGSILGGSSMSGGGGGGGGGGGMMGMMGGGGGGSSGAGAAGAAAAAHGGEVNGYADGGAVGYPSLLGDSDSGAKYDLGVDLPLPGAPDTRQAQGEDKYNLGVDKSMPEVKMPDTKNQKPGVYDYGDKFDYGGGSAYNGMKDLVLGIESGIKKIFSMGMGAHGGKVDGEGLVKGDSYKNDVVPAMLSPHEIVLPRSVTQSPDAAEKARKFVEAIKKSHKPNEKVEYRHVLKAMGE